ncbi:unnamed protein product [Polarella glacialis]|uniref:Ubiquitin-like domain-containing protein n=1 Tax=Polarella glacialis TaxID=89957 RepID=A0A813JVF7_POLGL|nr:unnamed protein product [Polarella glacialis]
MKVTVFYSSDATKSAAFDVQPSDTVKSVKQKVIALHSPPDWANTALLAVKDSTEYFDNRKRLAQCGIADGAVLKFTYARNLTLMEKVELNVQGTDTGNFQLPPMSISTLPPKVAAY